MSAFIRYQTISIIRSLKFIPPVVVFLAWVFIQYAYKNVPILSSYGGSSIALYLAVTWITMAIFTLQEESEKHILFTHLGNKLSYLIGTWLAALVMMIPLLLFAILFPIVTGSFKGSMTVELYAFSFFSHIVFALFGFIVGTIFSATKLAVKKYAWLSAVFVIVVSLAAKPLIETAPVLKAVVWIFPPVYQVIEHMNGGELLLMKESLLGNVTFAISYILIGGAITMLLFRKRHS